MIFVKKLFAKWPFCHFDSSLKARAEKSHEMVFLFAIGSLALIHTAHTAFDSEAQARRAGSQWLEMTTIETAIEMESVVTHEKCRLNKYGENGKSNQMEKKKIRILAIESSCDETAAAVIGIERDESGLEQPVILSNIISSQVDLHAKTGGVVPEVASRAHTEAIIPVIAEALIAAKCYSGRDQESSENKKRLDYRDAFELLDDISHIAVTAGPGLIGSLLVGFNAAKAMAYARNLPIVPINHIEGHIYSAFAEEISHEAPINKLKNEQINNSNEAIRQLSNDVFPVLALTVSGGHTSLTLMKDHGVYEEIGSTLDDAVGEAYDKVAKLLDLGYPGGPVISKLAGQFRNNLEIAQFDNLKINNSNKAIKQYSNDAQRGIVFPRPIINDGSLNFSFSGLKTAVLQKVKEVIAECGLNSPADIPMNIKEEIAYAFEEAVADVLCAKAKRAIEKYGPKKLIFAGGVSANAYLRNRLGDVAKEAFGVQFITPTTGLYGDNAAMIGLAAYYHVKAGNVCKWQDITVDSGWEL